MGAVSSGFVREKFARTSRLFRAFSILLGNVVGKLLDIMARWRTSIFDLLSIVSFDYNASVL